MKKLSTSTIILLSVIGFIVIAVVSSACYANSLRNDGVRMENRLNAQYLDNQNYLSSYVSGFYEQVGVAQAQTAALDQVLTDAVKGRYDGKTTAQPGTGQLFSAIVEAYPELSLQELQRNWGKIQTYIQSQREGYRNIQSKLLDMLQTYDSWRDTGNLWKRSIIGMGFMGTNFPTNALKARIGTQVTTGQAALDQMYLIVLDSTTVKAYQTGTLDPLRVPTSPGR